MKTCVVLDLETTGLHPKTDRILEIGALKIVDGRTVDSYHVLINPQMQIPYEIQELTGITQAMTEEGEKSETALGNFLDFCGELPLLGHNIMFDYSFVKHKAVNLGFKFEKEAVDTLKIARKALPDLPSRSLAALCRYYRIDQGNAHRALDDTRSTWQLYQYLERDFLESQPEIFKPQKLMYTVKKQRPITFSQKVYLNDLLRYHRIETDVKIESLTKSEASRMIDKIILNHGRVKR
ncbi:3'-5' exonuclease [Ruminococcus sp. OA3]|uniref:3'-5' exonuclease n=1 Tax=Ruminococcus sp. OA3 TaxID=2914164 RepID=UPI001F061F45|nr:3'-5' exonuclease [Ruminococcus sp. OA3]MCH1984386.1 3'-5' exonuclease [Ruminococcus sp. OA3]